jgi:hypothetical protein
MDGRGCLVVVLVIAWAAYLPAAAAVNGPPYFTSTPPTEAREGDTYAYDANATDPDNDQLTYYILPVQKIGDMNIVAESGFFSWTPSKAGPQPITIWVTDGSHEVMQTFTLNITPRVNKPPVINSTPPGEAYVGELYAYKVNATDPNGGKIYYFLPQSPKGMAIDQLSGLVTWTPGAEFTNLSSFVLIAVKNTAELEADQSYTINVTRRVVVQNNPPSVRGTPVTTATEGELYFYAVDAVDPDGDRLSFCLTIGPPEMTVDSQTGVITWTPVASDVRIWDIRVAISDGTNTLNYNFSLNVRSKNIEHYNEDPAKASASPEPLCLFLPAMAVLLQISLILAWSRRR